MGRVHEVDHFDGTGTALPYPWGSANAPASSISYSYDGNATTITDEASKVKTQTVDGLGRLSSVTEDPGSSPHLNYLTNYAYDVADNLTTVCQGASIMSGICQGVQPRTFVYDSMSRLYQTTNPENGTITYHFDGNGNLLNKTDARGVATTMAYDCLNRVISKTYSDYGPGNADTPWVTYDYDGNTTATTCGAGVPVAGANLLGHRTSVYSASITNLQTYDPFGDVTSSQQITGGTTYNFPNYSYNLLGEITSVTYPSGRTVSTAYDTAGRATCVTAGSLTNCSPTTACASSVTYAANNQISILPLGNTLTEETTFNSRFQPTQIQLGSQLTLGFTYGMGTLGTTGDNGNVLSQTITRGSQVWTQSYGYDGVNRLNCANEVASSTAVACPGSGSSWKETESYDAFGNRWANSSLPLSVETPKSSSWFQSNNRISGWYYDCAGNVTGIPLNPPVTPACGTAPSGSMLRTATYDAENRMISETSSNAVTTRYSYDGDGRRISKSVGGVAPTVYVYDAAGQMTAEYGTPTDNTNGTQYLTADTLGSTRLTTDSSGNVKTCYDYLPFGVELLSGLDSRPTNCFSSGLDLLNIKFTGKERDAERGLDFFGARYCHRRKVGSLHRTHLWPARGLAILRLGIATHMP